MNKKFHDYGFGFYADNKEAVKAVIEQVEACASTLPAGSYEIRIKDADAPAQTERSICTFGMALEAVQRGKGARLPHWKEDVVIRCQFPDEHSKMTAPYLYVESRLGRVPWKETMIELFAENWEIVD